MKLQYLIDSQAAACKNSSGWVPIEINKARHLMNLGDHNGVNVIMKPHMKICSTMISRDLLVAPKGEFRVC